MVKGSLLSQMALEGNVQQVLRKCSTTQGALNEPIQADHAHERSRNLLTTL